mmetsp:Transcript_23956/g.42866  ORF Transcript_23956/g.42866 Transcript_23956/m.42866 type:complete len:220 (+) Transcript_23956:797-1456(+)
MGVGCTFDEDTASAAALSAMERFIMEGSKFSSISSSLLLRPPPDFFSSFFFCASATSYPLTNPSPFHFTSIFFRIFSSSAAFRPHVTFNRKTMVFRSVAAGLPSSSTSNPYSSKSRGSTLSGINPSRCDNTSSWINPELFHMYTNSNAMVGTSAIMILLKALAKEISTPTNSNTNSFLDGRSRTLRDRLFSRRERNSVPSLGVGRGGAWRNSIPASFTS